MCFGNGSFSANFTHWTGIVFMSINVFLQAFASKKATVVLFSFPPKTFIIPEREDFCGSSGFQKCWSRVCRLVVARIFGPNGGYRFKKDVTGNPRPPTGILTSGFTIYDF